MVKVLHLLASADRRGAEVFGHELASRLAAEGLANEVLALAPARAGSAALDVEVLAGGFPRSTPALRKRASDFDVVIGHGSTGLGAGAAATVGSRRRFIYRSIGDPNAWGAATTSARLKVTLALRTASAVVSLWPEAADTVGRAYGVGPERRAVIPNAADPQRFRPPSPSERAAARGQFGLGSGPVLAIVGAFGPEKRVPLAIEAMAHLPEATLLIAGDGPQRPLVEAAAAEVGERVQILGSVEDLRPIYHAADAVVSVSSTEGQSGVLIEALLSGLGVVATSVGGTPSVLTDRSCRAVPADPSPMELAEAIREVLAVSDADRAAGRDHAVEMFGFDSVTKAWADLIRRALA